MIVWAIVFGFVVFGDVPEIAMLIGAVIIICAGIYIFVREQVRAREKRTDAGFAVGCCHRLAGGRSSCHERASNRKSRTLHAPPSRGMMAACLCDDEVARSISDIVKQPRLIVLAADSARVADFIFDAPPREGAERRRRRFESVLLAKSTGPVLRAGLALRRSTAVS